MRAQTFTACVAGVLGCTGCSLLTQFDPAVTSATDGSVAGVSACATDAGRLLCEDFEHGLTSTWTRTVDAGGTWDIEESQVHSGKHALHLHTDMTADRGATVTWEKVTTSDWAAPLDVRVFVYWTGSLAQTVANFLQLQNRARNAGYVLYAGQNQIGWSAWATGLAEGTSSPPPTGTWTCVEWAFAAPDVSGRQSVEVYVGDSLVSKLQNESAPVVNFSELDIGLSFQSSTDPPMDLYLDDVVMDTHHIGCN
jgi:hypothetical protein